MEQPKEVKPTEPVKKATAGFVISLIGGIIDALVAIMLLAAASILESLGESLPGFGMGMGGFASDLLTTWGVLGLIFAVIVIIGAILIYMPGREIIGGIIVIVFSFASFPFTAGGLFIGLILGIIGGALGLAKK